MKKKLFIGLMIFSLIFLGGGIYIISTIESNTSALYDLITLHQIEILREHLLIQVNNVQDDLYLKNTRYARNISNIVYNVKNMDKIIETCLECHHTEYIGGELIDLKRLTSSYKNSLSRAFTIRANITRLEREEDVAFKIGEGLIAKINKMIVLTKSRLDSKTQSILREITNTKIILFVLVALGPIIALGLAIVVIKAFTKPVNVLLNATKRLKGGQLDYRIEGLKDEFGEVAKSFNEMAGSLKEQMLKMQRVEQMTVVGEMAARLAHEIKNPLAGIKAAMQVLSDEAVLGEEDSAILVKVVDEVKRIELLLKSILNFAKPPKPQFRNLNVNHILDKTLTFSLKYPSLSLNGSSPINIKRNFDKSLPNTMADSMQLEQVFLNLTLNASEAMPDGGTLNIKTSQNNPANSIQIEISDTGDGIDEEIMDKIFNPFFTSKPKGTGLGLAIAKQVIDQHGGTISAAKNPAGGSSFTITLPLKTEEQQIKSEVEVGLSLS